MKKSKNGFTLAESLLVMVIIMLICGIMMPSICQDKRRSSPPFIEKSFLQNIIQVVDRVEIIEPTGVVKGIVCVRHFDNRSVFEIITTDRVKPGAWDEALRAKLLYYDSHEDWYVPMKSVTIPTLEDQ